MVTRQKTKNDAQPRYTSRASIWLGVLLVVISFASLSLVFTSFPSAAFASINSPLPVSSNSIAEPYNLNATSNITTFTANIASTGRSSQDPIEHSSNTIPSPAPLSLVALLLLVLASAIRRHQNQV